MRFRCVAVLLVFGGLAWGAPAHRAPEAQRVEQLPAGVRPVWVTLSPDGRRYAYVKSVNWKMIAVVDGKEDPPVDWIAENRITFSADSKHYAYQAKSPHATWMVLDGVAGRSYEKIDDWGLGKQGQLAYASQRNGKSYPVSGTEEGAACQGLRLALLPDDGVPAWVAREGTEQFLFRGDQRSRGYEGVFDVRIADGKVAYRAVKDGQQFIVVNGQEGRRYDKVSAPALAGGHAGYAAARGEQYFFVIDAVESRPYELGDLVPPLLSADGKRSFYVGTRNGRAIAVVDGVEKAQFNWVSPVRRFSADGRRLMYVAGRIDGRSCVVVDGAMGPAYDAIASAVMSEDGSKVAYLASRGNRFVGVVDGNEMGTCDSVEPATLALSPDSRHVGWVGRRGALAVVMVDGTAVGAFDEVMTGGGLAVDNNGAAHFFAARKEDGKWVLVRE